MDIISISEKERQGMMFTTIARLKYLNGLQFQPPFSYDRYEKMAKLISVAIKIVEGNKLTIFLLFTFSIIQHYYIVTLHSK